MPVDQAVEQFLAAAESWLCDGYALDVRYLAWLNGERWEILEASMTLLPLPPSHDHTFHLSCEGWIGGHLQVHPISKVEAMNALRLATTGRVEIRHLCFALAPLNELDTYSEMSHRDRWFLPLHLRVASMRASAPSSLLAASVDAHLRTADPPFDGMTDLVSWLGLSTDLSGTRAPSITLSVSPPVDLNFEGTRLSENVLRPSLYAHQNADLSKVDLAVRAAPGVGLTARRRVGDTLSWSDASQGFRRGEGEIQLANADSVLTLLSFAGQTVRRQWIVDPLKARNARYLSVSHFDPDLRMLRQALFDAPESRKFEQAVGVLLHMLGFSAALPIETDSPDLVVATPAGQAIVVESTTRIADFASKIGKLVERRAFLSKALAAANLPASVSAALVCRLGRDEIAASPAELLDRNVLLITASDLESALLRARFVVDPDEFLNEAIAALTSSGRRSE
ncbi:MAG: hypothetical protein K9J82_16715 [Methylotenera sp.]|jgi:hypothetical protein|nr:hypothetical protein [Methylotenera sp.]